MNISAKSWKSTVFLGLLMLGGLNSCKKSDSTPTTKVPVLTVTDLNNPSDGTIILAPFNSANQNVGYLYMLDKNGKLLKSKTTAHNAINFERWVINGTVRYSYTEYDPDGYHIPGVLYSSGDNVVLDENFNEIKRFKFIPGNGHGSDQDLVDSHEFILLGDDHYITMTYYAKKVSNIPSSLNPSSGVQIVAPIIQEVNNGSVVFEWDASNYPEFYTESQEWNNFSDSSAARDYIHLNSIFIDPKDNNLIISMRNLNKILKINRTSGAIMWELGGVNSDFAQTPDQVFLRQHNATLTDSGKTLILFDNGEATQRPQTRIVEMQIDEVNHKITSFKATPVPNNVFTQYMGSVQKRGNTYFIGGGSGNYIMEIDNTSAAILFQVKMDQSTYRAFKF